MTSVDRVKAICKERKIAISHLEKTLGFSNGYIGQLRKGVLPDDRLKLIADYLNVSVNYLMTGSELTKDSNKMPSINRLISGKEGLVAILADIYGRCEDTETFGEYGSCFYYSIGTGKSRYAIEELDFDRLYSSVKQIVMQMTDVIKKNEHIVQYERKKAVGTPVFSTANEELKISDKACLEPQAAHKRTDIEVTDEMHQYDDNIMNDDSEWE